MQFWLHSPRFGEDHDIYSLGVDQVKQSRRSPAVAKSQSSKECEGNPETVEVAGPQGPKVVDV